MLRSCRRTAQVARLRAVSEGSVLQTRRKLASSSVKCSETPSKRAGGGSSKWLFGLGLPLAGVGAAVAYAGTDIEFRKTLEDSVPGSSFLLDIALGEKPVEKKTPPAAIATPPSKKPVKKIEGSSAPVVVTSTPPPPPITAPPPPPPSPPTLAPPVMVSAMPLSAEKKKSPEPSLLKDTPPPPPETPTILKQEVKEEEEPKKETSKIIEQKSENAEPIVAPSSNESTKVESVSKEEEPVVDVAAEKDFHRRLNALKEKLESDLRLQLKRQAEAHADHVNDALDVQFQELSRKHARELDESVEKAVLRQREELAAVLGHVRGLQDALEARAGMDKAAVEAQELWLASSALEQAINRGDGNYKSIVKEVNALKIALEKARPGGQDPFVKTIIEAIPSDAVKAPGLCDASHLKERFLKVEKLAKRTAMIGDEGGSIFKYALSYLQSLFILEPSRDEIPSKFTATNVDALDTFDIVWLARAALERDDLEQAVRYMTLLRGEPGKLAGDWVSDARTLLETRQAVSALMSHAAAIGAEALPLKQ